LCYETRFIAIKVTKLCCNVSFFYLAIVKETTKGWNSLKIYKTINAPLLKAKRS
jgi:hypothetical protein